MITKDIIERVKDSANIVEVVSEYISLKKQGVYYVGLCPFHDDHHPSMKVSTNRGTYHCYSCDAKGDAIKFVQEKEHVSFPEAVRRLANKYGISIPSEEKSEEEKKHDRLATNLYKTNAWVAKFYVDALTKSAEDSAVKQYIRMRGISDEILSKFQIGYSPADTSLFAKAYKEAGLYFNNAKILGLGYIGRGFVKDRYADRVIFPWFNVAGNVVGFGARKLDERTHGIDQKYINSQESEIFHKNSELYGLYQAKSAILKAGKVYMVEGYTDVLAFHQAGIENFVANSGTALTGGKVDECMAALNIVANNGGKVVAKFVALSSNGTQIQFTSDQCTINRRSDKVSLTDDGAKLVVAKVDDTDYAYFHTGRTSGLSHNNAASTTLARGAKLVVLGFPLGIGANSANDINPILGSGLVAAPGLQKGVILITDSNYEQGNSGGPVFKANNNGNLEVISLVSAGAGNTMGFIVPIAAVK